MRTRFVETGNVQKFQQALGELRKRGAGEACLMIIDGQPGLGKTSTLVNWTAKNQCLYLRAKQGWRPAWMMNEILTELRQQPPYRFEEKYKMALGAIGQRQDDAHINDQVFSIVVDEADHISRNRDCMEALRDLSDTLEVPIIFVGMGRIRSSLTRYPQIMSRVSQYVGFEAASKEDIRALFNGLCEVAVADDMVDFVHKASKGLNREVMEAIAAIERYGLRNDPLNGEAFGLDDMAGRALLNDRQSGGVIRVPGEIA